MVEAGHDEPDRPLEQDREDADQEARQRLLRHDHVEEAVEEVVALFVVEERVARVDRPQRDLGDDAREDATLEQRDQVQPQCHQDGEQREHAEQHDRQRYERRRDIGCGD